MMAAHRGVYGLWQQDGRLVLVRKTRGPYTGLLDLPGGTPEAGETTEQTLRRELHEETGVELTGVLRMCSFSIHVTADAEGLPIDLLHEGWIAEVQVTGTLRVDIVDEDVSGVVLADAPSREQLSPLAIEALLLFPPYAINVPGPRLNGDRGIPPS
ncbi:NUDIX domain-containing protein [Brachybacterium sp. YJGR34]|uniref:NUDIX domain-containing protein n=1 Tax=Brachybacterium sp. YJGR34 TaxID=2059911 RepID=UPI000E0A74ED|nr:NUDIX domain-containing protein [Brachybacterium sp. YJGR34]